MRILIDIDEKDFQYCVALDKIKMGNAVNTAIVNGVILPASKDVYKLADFCERNELPFDELLCILGAGCCEIVIKAIREDNGAMVDRFRNLKTDIIRTLQKEGVNIE